MIPTGLAILIIAVCVLGEGFFSGSEMALVSVDRISLRHNAKRGQKDAKLVASLLKQPEWVLGTTIIGTNICTVTSTMLATALSYKYLQGAGVFVAIFCMSLINWIFAEIVPKSIFQQYADVIAPKIARPLRIMSLILTPLVRLFSGIASYITTALGGELSHKLPFISKEELKILMKISDKTNVDPNERKMIGRLLSFKEKKAEDVMVPLIQVTALPEDAIVQEAVQIISESKHRRLPVYRERVDNIIGILNSFDVIGENNNNPIRGFIRPAFYVPPNMSIHVLFEQMKKSGNNMAIIVDEYGGAEGIVTIEDILEEVVGKLEDEYDQVRLRYKIQKDGTIIASGKMEIQELNDKFGLNLPEGDYETIGGLIITHLQKIPRPGEKLNLPNVTLTVLRASQRVIHEVAIRKNEPTGVTD
ncbi:MAG TPA: hemolysin family protein [Candidatus Marinimicrobia bacterium]|nr:hemolysin family protein [Candidatus Neomarinimicrobiota bacterium]HRS52502.1 hemolysin family protein [Candidatus Neomarinimicrobiota bacterium]HRU93101.1 hemolysin family protein [Candidatus Neomarinimicrobiota bacterium]